MADKKLSELTNKAILEKSKKQKSIKLYDAVIIGLLIGIAIYGAVKNGVGLFTFIPLIYLPIVIKNNNKNKALEKLLKERNLL